MLRIHFSPDDLTRVRVASSPDPLAETILSLPVLQAGELGGVAMAGWRERTRRSVRPGTRLLFDLVPPTRGECVPDAFTHAATDTLTDSLCHTWSLPSSQWKADLRATEQLRPRVPRWIHELHQGDRRWRELLQRALHDFHAVAVAPYWSQILAAAHTDRSRRALDVVDAGVEGLLAKLHPGISWSSPVLSVSCHVTADLWLEGRGLLLAPTFFWPEPLAFPDNADAGRPVVLRYPIARDLAAYRSVWAASAPADGALAALLGTTRARALQAMATPAGTAELARRTRTSPATASHHATVLRGAGLLTTERDGSGVRHTLTPMGRALLHGAECLP
ncbi:helix-turn-helix transcriptional regulator [Streptomyces sp. I05A-00742]|uniref:ArsR/SmtB family transcription factor n=1 Tax=Streptomyces sp. I05A-00742 TaxID=2732853 RepID=UPI001488CC15|nr:winged helix-turn-helix domain-containing protein [Streptomyces sp. I05A-00742]